jgi:hypothetical protein
LCIANFYYKLNDIYHLPPFTFIPKKLSNNISFAYIFLNFFESLTLLLGTNLTLIDFKSFKFPIDLASISGLFPVIGYFVNIIL